MSRSRTLTGLVAAALSVVFAVPAAADVLDNNPGAAALGAGSVYVFARGDDGTIRERHTTAAGWSAWTPLPGLRAGSGPAAAPLLSTLQVFARGEDDTELWQNSLEAGRWSGWVKPPNPLVLTSAPAVVKRRGPAILHVAARGADNAIYHRTLTPAQATPWSAWTSIGGNFSSAPAIESSVTDHINVFVRAANGNVHNRFWDPGPGWYPSWVNEGGSIIGAPAAASGSAGELDLFVRWSDRGLYQRHWAAGTWTAWTSIDPTPLDSSPAAASDQPGRMYVFARIGAEIHYKLWTALPAPAWTPWRSLGRPAPAAQAPTPTPAPPVEVPAPPTQPPKTVAAPTRIVPVLAFNYRAARRTTRLHSLTVKGVPRGATVRATCRTGCSAKSVTVRNARSQVSLRRLIRKPLRVGTTITVVVSKPGSIGGVKILRVRARRAPSVATRCLPPGARAHTRC